MVCRYIVAGGEKTLQAGELGRETANNRQESGCQKDVAAPVPCYICIIRIYICAYRAGGSFLASRKFTTGRTALSELETTPHTSTPRTAVFFLLSCSLARSLSRLRCSRTFKIRAIKLLGAIVCTRARLSRARDYIMPTAWERVVKQEFPRRARGEGEWGWELRAAPRRCSENGPLSANCLWSTRELQPPRFK